MSKICRIFVLSVAVCTLFSCKLYNEKTYTSERICLGTVCSITIYGKIKNPYEIMDKVWAKIGELENTISCKRENSVVWKLNSGVDVQIDNDTKILLETAEKFMNLTNGAFSPYLKEVSDLWGIGTDNAKIPTNQEILDARAKKQLDFGALGKGYASDIARQMLLDFGVKSAIINFGGNICCIGNKPDGKPFLIGLQDPLSDRGVYKKTVKISDSCVISSGDYERFFEKDGVRYCHIMDGRTGYPVNNGVHAVTVIGKSGLLCDALSTVCFILGEQESVEILEKYPEYNILFFYE